MNRALCPKHVHHLRVQGKSAQLDTPNCSICKWERRPKRLLDLARMFENAASAMRYSHQNPDFDPIGLYWSVDLEKAVLEYVKAMNPSYRENFIKSLEALK